MTAKKRLLPDIEEFGWGSYIKITGFVGFIIYEPEYPGYGVNVDVGGFSVIIRAVNLYYP